MKYVGAHVSASGGVENAPLNARKIGAKAFAFFTKNQRQWKSKPLSEKSIRLFKENLIKADISPDHVLVHDSYLINIGSPKAESREKSVSALIDEALRVELLGLKYLVLHPGSHLRIIDEEECVNLIAESLNRVISESKNTILLLETTAGMGSNIGYKFEHIRSIIDKVFDKNRVGVCIDTCHIFAAGYDITNIQAYEETMAKFDKIIGFDYLKGVHLNDSKMDMGSKKDRHHSIGQGVMGTEPFKFLMKAKRFDDIALVLETIDESIWEKEIEMLNSFTES